MFSDELKKGISKLSKELEVGEFTELVHEKDALKRKRVLQEAKTITQQNFGKKVGMLAPLYLDNHCVNNCKYCGMRKDNVKFKRSKLSAEQLIKEVEIMNSFSYNNIELVTGQLPMETVIGLAKVARSRIKGSLAAYFGSHQCKDYCLLKKIGVDLLFLWQETYNIEQYQNLHPIGTLKNDIWNRMNVYELALESGINNFAIGILFGLSTWQDDVLTTILHGKYLEKKGAKIAVVGTPRFQPANGAILKSAPFPVSDDDYIYACALYRLAFPNAHLFVSTRESEKIREIQLRYYGTLTNAECSTDVGGYTKLIKEMEVQQQFSHENPSTDSVLAMVNRLGKKIDYDIKLHD